MIYFVRRPTMGLQAARPGRIRIRIGFGVDPAALRVVAGRLAVPPGPHHPFRSPPLLRPLYPDRR